MKPLPLLLIVFSLGCHLSIQTHKPVSRYPDRTVHVTPRAATSASVTLGWVLSSANNIASQTLSYGPSAGNYTNSTVLGPSVTQFQVTNLLYSTPYYFAVRCADVNGLSSAYSIPLSFTTTNAPVPPPTPPPPPTGLKIISAP